MNRYMPSMRGMLLTVLLTCTAQAQKELNAMAAPDITEAERKVLLSNLQIIDDDVKAQRMGLYSEAYAVLTAALVSDLELKNFYEKCCKTIGENAQGGAYEKSMDFNEEIRSKIGKADLLRALRIQVDYLILSIRASQAIEPHEFYPLLPELIKFIERVMVEDEDLRQNRHLRFVYGSVQDSVFARALKLNGSLKVSQPWSWKPMDVRGLYESCIIPAVRKADSLNMLQSAWQSRLRHERVLAERRANEKELEMQVFEKEQLPLLYWQRAQDFYKAGDQRVAIDEMLRLIKENRYHKNSQDWIRFLRALLQMQPG